MWYVYILKCKSDRLYTGITLDLARRLKEHQQGKGGNFTKAFGADKIVYYEECPTRSAALKREAQIKKCTRSQKVALIAGKGNK